jgi:hypothetical protein
MTKAVEHLRGMLQRTDLSPYDGRMIRDVLSDHDQLLGKVDEVIVHGGQALACSKTVQVAYKEMERDARHAKEELAARDKYLTEVEGKVQGLHVRIALALDGCVECRVHDILEDNITYQDALKDFATKVVGLALGEVRGWEKPVETTIGYTQILPRVLKELFPEEDEDAVR